MDDHGSVEEATFAADGRPYDQNRVEFPRDVNKLTDGAFNAIEEGPLKEQVVDRISRQAEFRKDHECGPDCITLPRGPDCLVQIGGNLCYLCAPHA
jgi:hypothetical protein